MGVIPLQFRDGDSADSLGLDGTETFDIQGLAGLSPGSTATVRATASDGATQTFEVKVRADAPVEVEYLRNGGILQTVLRQLSKETA